ncbi:hypothetical protein [Streptomyces beigongshangae]|uniref:hypothetical protein n=1 Tax=Streptomyces beigongshangae TaxID=2841597 RepID=UPI001C846627|nr:hypothetical protein [Streptomyces sp. REN17]
MSATDAVEFRDGHHAARPASAGPQPNARLTGIAAGLEPGTAPDLGHGGGGDATGLARQGWRVTAVDVSAVAAGRPAGPAAAHGPTGRIAAGRHDPGESFPHGAFDLVSAHCPHTPPTGKNT